MIKQATFGDVHNGLRAHLESIVQTGKGSKTASISTEQGVQQNTGVPEGKSDPEVKAILPNSGQPGSTPTDLVSERGKPVGEKLPDQPSPSEEERERKETSPETKLAGAEDGVAIANRLAGHIKEAALLIKTAEPVPSKPDAPSSEFKETGVTGGTSNSDTGTPKVQGSQKVTQTNPGGGTPERKLEQGTKLESAPKTASVDLDTLAQNIARFSNHFNFGYNKTAALIDLCRQAGSKVAAEMTLQPEELQTLDQAINAKVAEWQAAGWNSEQIAAGIEQLAAADAENLKVAAYQEQHTAICAAHALASIGVESGILSQGQVEALLKTAGLVEEAPVIGADIRQKVASCRATGMQDEQILGYIQKVASGDLEGAAAMQPEGGPAPEELQQALASVVGELMQAVHEGQISEEDALNLLRQEGLPVDDLIGDDGAPVAGAAPAPGAPAPGGDLAGGLPPEAAAAALPPEAGAGAPPELGGGAPEGGIPAPAPGGEGGGAPKPPGGGEGGDKPKSEGGDKPKGEGGEKKEDGGGDKKSDGGGEKKSEGGDKPKSDSGEKKEAKCDCSNDPCTCKKAEGELPGGAEAALAGDSVSTTEGGEGGAEGGDTLEGLLAQIQALVEAGKLPAEVGAQLAAQLQGAGGAPEGGDPTGALAGAGGAGPEGAVMAA